MKFRRQRKDELAINLTPLIDVVFLLLIFFMVSTSFTSETQLAVNLPEATGEPATDSPLKLDLMISADGLFRLNGEAIPSDARGLRKALRLAAGTRRDLPLTIAADGSVAHRHVVTALDAANVLGFQSLTIAAQSPKNSEDTEVYDG